MPLFKRRPKAADVAPVERATYRVPSVGGASLLTPSGVSVDAQSALRSAAVWACQRVLVATITNLPVDVIRVQAGRRTEVTPQPLVVRNPSGQPSIRRRAWVGQAVRSMLQHGNIYGQILSPDGAGRPSQVEILDGGSVQWRKVDGQLVPFVDNKARAVWPVGDLWHVPASQLMVPGSPVAMSPTEAGATAIGAGIAAEEFSAKFFGQGAHPTAVLKNESNDLTEEQAEAVKRKITQIMAGSREPLVLGAAWTFDKFQVSPEDSQFLDTMRFEVEQACRIYGVPPSMVYSSISGQAVTYQNLSDSDLGFLKYGVSSWIVDLEDAWSEFLVAPQVVKFNVNAMLRMDAMKRAELAEIRLRNKLTTINEQRVLEDEEPFSDPSFDEPGVPGSAPAVDPSGVPA